MYSSFYFPFKFINHKHIYLKYVYFFLIVSFYNMSDFFGKYFPKCYSYIFIFYFSSLIIILKLDPVIGFFKRIKHYQKQERHDVLAIQHGTRAVLSKR